MPRSITIRDVPDEVVDELAARARRSGRSMQEYLKGQLVDISLQPDPAQFWRDVGQRKAMTGSTLSTEFILETLDELRR
jgi:hypothetical protein